MKFPRQPSLSTEQRQHNVSLYVRPGQVFCHINHEKTYIALTWSLTRPRRGGRFPKWNMQHWSIYGHYSPPPNWQEDHSFFLSNRSYRGKTRRNRLSRRQLGHQPHDSPAVTQTDSGRRFALAERLRKFEKILIENERTVPLR